MANRIKDSNITPGTITNDKLAPGTISSASIAPGTIANDRLANTGITINGTTIALGASGTIVAGTDWQAVVTADGSTATTASAGEGYFIDTTSAAHTVTLPSSPTQGDEVTIVDYAGTFGTNNVTVGRNGSNIDGTASDGTLATNRLNVRFVYIDATQGWRAIFDDASENYGATFVTATGGTVTTSGDYKIHTFTGDGCFVVSCGGNEAGSTSVDYLVVAGGGGGGRWYGAGGGAGGYRFSDGTVSGCYSAGPAPLGAPALPVTATTYPITVGGGGTGGILPARSTNGSNSVFSTITSAGGGGGGGNPGSSDFPGTYPGNPGGSGGGAKANAGFTGTSGSGNTPPVSPPQGNPAGNASSSPEINSGGGGAGGSSNPGATDPSAGGLGGVGLTSCITGSPVGRGGGGAGNSDTPPHGNSNPTGAPFGGGVSNSPTTSGASGTANTGGGGGAGALCAPNCGPEQYAGSGGKGIVIIRYKFQ